LIVELNNEKAIVERCQNGDINAFEAIYRHYEKPMYLFALRMLNHDDAREAIQLSLIKLYQNINKYRFQAKFSTYIFKILINVCYDLNKKNKTESLEIVRNEIGSVQEQDSELKAQLEKSILTLPDRMRECFVLFAVEGFKQDEIAEMLSISIGAVKAHIYKAKQKLKILLADVMQETIV